jgi:hypothetical protein
VPPWKLRHEAERNAAYLAGYFDARSRKCAGGREILFGEDWENRVQDEIGVSPNRRGKDPVILGRIKGPQYKSQYFLLAWYLDTRAL